MQELPQISLQVICVRQSHNHETLKTDSTTNFREWDSLPNNEKKIMNKAEIFITRRLPTRVNASRPAFSLWNQRRPVNWKFSVWTGSLTEKWECQRLKAKCITLKLMCLSMYHTSRPVWWICPVYFRSCIPVSVILVEDSQRRTGHFFGSCFYLPADSTWEHWRWAECCAWVSWHHDQGTGGLQGKSSSFE